MIDEEGDCIEIDKYYSDLFQNNISFFIGHECIIIGSFKNFRIPITGRLIRMRKGIIHKLASLKKKI